MWTSLITADSWLLLAALAVALGVSLRIGAWRRRVKRKRERAARDNPYGFIP